MKRVAFCTLGCKVNQYDSEAMLEQFVKAGYQPVPFEERADVYVVNTCVVTGTGEKKSRQMVRRAQKQSAQADVVIAGCMAQRDAEKLLAWGVRLVVGNARRGDVVELLHKATGENLSIAAVEDIRRVPFETLNLSGHTGYTRAVVKIQEGCDRFCTYCIIPYVRGGIRSRPVEEIAKEAERMAAAGFRELVITGIHVASYGRDLIGVTLLDALRAACEPEGITRVRLSSIEPVIVDEGFCRALKEMPKLCPQFHLALQSGSDTVLKRMRRRYSVGAFRNAAALLRRYFPGCALTTDVLCGFPGETQEEHEETLAFLREMAFSRIHAFPYSKRSGTPAASMPGQLDKRVKALRTNEVIALGDTMAVDYAKALLNTRQDVLFETAQRDGAEGYTPQYMRVWAQGARPGDILNVKLTHYEHELFLGEI
ncbi:MAG: tRNA (N(6)-L-threonylcarbamoyladenosine(37)-C(2))-methylthiotransferase MtaB [Eubacteriales bacterium]|jgi:threonylcarbamoyladenosine tRNA methylthiotransferase MtaB|nr:tRNA (N(6)-L-threonylcarbamoyladenosine(37)-C(2))-methylthiotransferase MtaB [Eubacteriales bacterium]